MTMDGKDPNSSSTITGVGEFERGSKHVLATVQIHQDMIESVGFGDIVGDDVECATKITAMVAGKSIGTALKTSSEQCRDSCPDCPGDRNTCEVLLEAFHRALETCLVS